MWTSRSETLAGIGGLRFFIDSDGQPVTFGEVVRGWQNDAGFRAIFNDLLADAPFSAFRWETPALSSATITQPFQFVLLDSPGLARRADPQAFAEQLGKTGGVDVVEFPNLGADAILIVPGLKAKPTAYGHLAAFVRGAPALQRQALWQRVGEALARRVGSTPVWLNTAGAGVPWLHIRLDDRPKYYGFGPYRQNSSDLAGT